MNYNYNYLKIFFFKDKANNCMINPHYLAKRRKELNFNDINYLFLNNNYFLIIFF